MLSSNTCSWEIGEHLEGNLISQSRAMQTLCENTHDPLCKITPIDDKKKCMHSQGSKRLNKDLEPMIIAALEQE